MSVPDTDLYFFHIPKTAGTSLGTFLASLYPREQQARFLTLDEMLAMPREQFNRHRYFQSHFGNLLYPLLDREVPTVTFLRDPFEQSISRLRFLVHYSENRKPLSFRIGVYLALCDDRFGPLVHRLLGRHYRWTGQSEFQTISLGVDFEPSSWKQGQNLVDCRHLQTMSRLRELGMDGVLEQAKRRLDSMAVVGITERFDESLGLVCDFLKVPPPEKSPVERVAPGRSIHSRYRDDPTVPKALARLVERHTFYDRQLYAYANSLLDRQLMNARLGPIARNPEDTPRQAA